MGLLLQSKDEQLLRTETRLADLKKTLEFERRVTEIRLTDLEKILEFERRVTEKQASFLQIFEPRSDQGMDFLMPEGMNIGNLISARETAEQQAISLKITVEKLEQRLETYNAINSEYTRGGASADSSNLSSLTALSNIEDDKDDAGTDPATTATNLNTDAALLKRRRFN